MVVPKQRKSRSKVRSHRANYYKIKTTWNTLCSNCKEGKPSHTVCGNCGFYKGRLVLSKNRWSKRISKFHSPEGR